MGPQLRGQIFAAAALLVPGPGGARRIRLRELGGMGAGGGAAEVAAVDLAPNSVVVALQHRTGVDRVIDLVEKVRGFAPGAFQYATDLAKARTLFAQAGVAEGTELRLMRPMEGDQAPAQLFQANLAQIGMTLTIEGVDFGTYLAIFFGDTPAEERPHVMRWSWQPDYNDAWTHLRQTISCLAWGSNGGNAGFYCNERVDELLAEAEDAADSGVYEAALAEAQEILSRVDPPAVYYAQPEWVTVRRRDVGGFVFNPIYLGTYDLHALYRAR